MNKKLLIYVSFILLFLSNVVFIALFLKAPHRRHLDPKQTIIKELKLKNDQVIAYEVLIKQHRKQTLALKDSIYNLETTLFSSISKNDVALQQSTLSEIGAIHANAALVNMRHFEEIRNLCDSSQLVLFHSLAPNLASIFSNRPENR